MTYRPPELDQSQLAGKLFEFFELCEFFIHRLPRMHHEVKYSDLERNPWYLAGMLLWDFGPWALDAATSLTWENPRPYCNLVHQGLEEGAPRDLWIDVEALLTLCDPISFTDEAKKRYDKQYPRRHRGSTPRRRGHEGELR